jgi:hypothetical protein
MALEYVDGRGGDARVPLLLVLREERGLDRELNAGGFMSLFASSSDRSCRFVRIERSPVIRSSSFSARLFGDEDGRFDIAG